MLWAFVMFDERIGLVALAGMLVRAVAVALIRINGFRRGVAHRNDRGHRRGSLVTLPFMAQTRWLSETEQRAWRAFIAAQRVVNSRIEYQLQHDSGMPPRTTRSWCGSMSLPAAGSG